MIAEHPTDAPPACPDAKASHGWCARLVGATGRGRGYRRPRRDAPRRCRQAEAAPTAGPARGAAAGRRVDGPRNEQVDGDADGDRHEGAEGEEHPLLTALGADHRCGLAGEDPPDLLSLLRIDGEETLLLLGPYEEFLARRLLNGEVTPELVHEMRGFGGCPKGREPLRLPPQYRGFA